MNNFNKKYYINIKIIKNNFIILNNLWKKCGLTTSTVMKLFSDISIKFLHTWKVINIE